jgi:hypothetical protein
MEKKGVKKSILDRGRLLLPCEESKVCISGSCPTPLGQSGPNTGLAYETISLTYEPKIQSVFYTLLGKQHARTMRVP